MLISHCAVDQWSEIHRPAHLAPHPSLPKASVNSSIDAFAVQWD